MYTSIVPIFTGNTSGRHILVFLLLNYNPLNALISLFGD